MPVGKVLPSSTFVGSNVSPNPTCKFSLAWGSTLSDTGLVTGVSFGGSTTSTVTFTISLEPSEYVTSSSPVWWPAFVVSTGVFQLN